MRTRILKWSVCASGIAFCGFWVVVADAEDLLETTLAQNQASMQQLVTGHGRMTAHVLMERRGLNSGSLVRKPKGGQSTNAEAEQLFAAMGVNPASGVYRAEYEWWFKGDHVRSDRTPLPLVQDEVAFGQFPWGRFSCDGRMDIAAVGPAAKAPGQEGYDRMWRVFLRDPFSPGQRWVVKLYNEYAVDVRQMMLSEGRDLRTFLTSMRDKKGFEVVAERDGQRIRITARKDGAIWREDVLDPAQGYHVVETRAKKPNQEPWLDSHAEYQKVGGVWFLKHLSIHEKGFSTSFPRDARAEIQIKEVTLNQPLDDGVFGLDGMDIPDGTSVWDQRGLKPSPVKSSYRKAETIQLRRIDAQPTPATRPSAATSPADPTPSTSNRLREEEWREERPWAVEGRVTDEKNQPLAGVEIVVRCGLGALKITGRTITGPDGRYTLRFQPGTWSHQNIGDWQFAKVAASKYGFANRDESRNADLWMAPRPLTGSYVGLPSEKMILPNRPYRLDLVMTAVPADTSTDDVPWGKDQDGVQLRIRPVQRVWRAGEKPAFKIEARNLGNFDLQLPENGTFAQVEVDGRWYAWDVDYAIRLKSGGTGTKLLPFPPGGSHRDLTVVLEEGWQAIKDIEVEKLAFRSASEGIVDLSPGTPRQELALAPGKHTIRVAHVARPASVWVRDELYKINRNHAAIRAVSNPVEIEILPTDNSNTTSEAATQPAGDRHEAFVFRLVNTDADQMALSLRKGLKTEADELRVVTDKRTNSVIVSTAGEARPRLAYLIAQLDKPKSIETDDAAQRVTKGFELKHAEATAVAEAIARLYPPSRAVNSWGTVTVQRHSEPEAVIVKCVAARVAEISALISLLDTADLPDVQIIKLLRLECSDAEDLASPMTDLAEQAGIRCRIGPDLAANALIVQADAATLGLVARLLKHFDRPGWPISESRLRPDARAKQQQERKARARISLLLNESTEKVIADTESADPSLVLRAFDTLAVRLCTDSLTPEQCGALAAAALKVPTRAPSRSATDHICVTLLDDLRLGNRLTDEQQARFFDSLITAEITTRPQSVLSIGIPARLTLSTRGKGTRLWFVIDSTGGLGISGGPFSGGGLGSSGPAGSSSGTCGALLKPRGLGPETIHATLNAKIYEWSFTGLLINDRPVLPSRPLHTIDRKVTAQTTVVEQEPPDYLKITSDPALEGQITSAISVRKVSQRLWGLEADIVARKPPVNLAVTMVAVAGDRRTEPVTLCIPRNVDDNYPTGLGRLLDVTHVDIVLTPDPKLARESVDLTEIWGKPIRFEHVPVVDEGEILGPQPELSSPSSGSDDVPLSEMEPLPIMERERLKDAMARWEQYQYTPIVVDRILEMVRGIKVRSHAELSRQQRDALAETLALFLRIAGKPDADALRQLHGITGAAGEYDLGDPALQKHHDFAFKRLRAMKVPEDQIPAGYADRQIKLAETQWKANGGPPIGAVAVSECRVVIGRVNREAFTPSQWDPREGGDSELIGRYVALGQSPVSLRGWLATKATRDKLMTPRNVLYADLRMPFKTEPDPANYGVFRFVWLEDPEKWVPVHSVWFYGGLQTRFYPCW